MRFIILLLVSLKFDCLFSGEMSCSVMRSLFLFVLAGLAEIGGGWLVWQWRREGKTLWWAPVGGAILFAYGVIPTWQSGAAFGPVYAAYGVLHHSPPPGARPRPLATWSIRPNRRSVALVGVVRRCST